MKMIMLVQESSRDIVQITVEACRQFDARYQNAEMKGVRQ